MAQLYQFGRGNLTKNLSKATEVYETLTHIPHAAYNLAQLHLYGLLDPVSPDYAKALQLALPGAMRRHTAASWLVGSVLFLGQGSAAAPRRRVKRDTRGALRYLRALAHMHSVAEHKHAYAAYEHGRVSESLLLYMLRGEMGFVVGQTNAAFILRTHRGNSEAPSASGRVAVVNGRTGRLRRQWRWTVWAAQQRDADALLALGDMCYDHAYSAGEPRHDMRGQSPSVMGL